MPAAAPKELDLPAIVARVEAYLDESLPKPSDVDAQLAPHLADAMRYSTMSPGKRLRAALVCGSCLAFGGRLEDALAPAAAVEYIHAYSLIHDDLPAMDDDDLRRGQPTCHVAFDEATAILAGDALQTLAFATLANAAGVNADRRLQMVALLSDAAGWRGMVGGQARDMAATGSQLDQRQLQSMHAGKTGALFRVSCQLGALCAPAAETHFDGMSRVGTTLGLAFQVVDDVLDETQTAAVLGKRAGKDSAAGKNTYPGIMGQNEATAFAHDLLDEALRQLEEIGVTEGPLPEIARATVQRIR